MKILAGNIKQLADSLGAIVSAIPLEISAAYKLMKVAKKVGLAQKAFEARRIQLLNEFGQTEDGKLVTEDGTPNGPVKFDEGEQEKFGKAFSILVNEDVELDINPISLDLLTLRASGNAYKGKDGEPVTVLPSILLGLDPIIEKDGEADDKRTEPDEGLHRA